jgi:hypothetical protein
MVSKRRPPRVLFRLLTTGLRQALRELFRFGGHSHVADRSPVEYPPVKPPELVAGVTPKTGALMLNGSRRLARPGSNSEAAPRRSALRGTELVVGAELGVAAGPKTRELDAAARARFGTGAVDARKPPVAGTVRFVIGARAITGGGNIDVGLVFDARPTLARERGPRWAGAVGKRRRISALVTGDSRPMTLGKSTHVAGLLAMTFTTRGSNAGRFVSTPDRRKSSAVALRAFVVLTGARARSSSSRPTITAARTAAFFARFDLRSRFATFGHCA